MEEIIRQKMGKKGRLSSIQTTNQINRTVNSWNKAHTLRQGMTMPSKVILSKFGSKNSMPFRVLKWVFSLFHVSCNMMLEAYVI